MSKVAVFRVFLVRIFPHSDWIQRDTRYLSIFSLNVGKCSPEKIPIRTLFTQWSSTNFNWNSNSFNRINSFLSHLKYFLRKQWHIYSPKFTEVLMGTCRWFLVDSIWLPLPDFYGWKKKETRNLPRKRDWNDHSMCFAAKQKEKFFKKTPAWDSYLALHCLILIGV